MIELLRTAAGKDPDQPAVVTEGGQLSFGQLAAQARVLAGALARHGVTRFAILDGDPAFVWSLLAAASLTGAEACVYPLATSDGDVEVLRQRFGHAVVVTSRELPGPGRLSPQSLLEDPGLAADAPEQPPAARPLLVLTSGTTGPAKAARHDWWRLVRGTAAIDPTPEHRWLLAYGLNQFGALQILMHVAAATATLVAGNSPRPRDGLAAMRRWGVTHASGTPTFWRFLLAELRADGGPVPALRQVTLGGEAVAPALLEQLRNRFPAARISQIYGSTEMGQTITVRDGIAGLPLSFLDDGGELTLKIVDGELWVRSTATMLGYFGEDPIPADAWRATGDLAEIVDGRIQFRGRVSEVINVGGVKVHPLPVEEAVAALDGVALARAYGRPNPVVGSIVALDVVPQAGADQEQVRADIRAACAQLPPAARPRSITFVTTLDTPGNKLIRGAGA